MGSYGGSHDSQRSWQPIEAGAGPATWSAWPAAPAGAEVGQGSCGPAGAQSCRGPACAGPGPARVPAGRPGPSPAGGRPARGRRPARALAGRPGPTIRGFSLRRGRSWAGLLRSGLILGILEISPRRETGPGRSRPGLLRVGPDPGDPGDSGDQPAPGDRPAGSPPGRPGTRSPVGSAWGRGASGQESSGSVSGQKSCDEESWRPCGRNPESPCAVAAAAEHRGHGPAPHPARRPRGGRAATQRRPRQPARRRRRDFSGVASVSSRTLCLVPLLVTTKRIEGWFIHFPVIMCPSSVIICAAFRQRCAETRCASPPVADRVQESALFAAFRTPSLKTKEGSPGRLRRTHVRPGPATGPYPTTHALVRRRRWRRRRRSHRTGWAG